MLDIFDVEHQTYDKKHAENLVSKIRNFKNILSAKENQKKHIEDKKELQKINVKIRKARAKEENLKIELFKLMSKVIVKNIRNYVKLSNNSPVTNYCNNCFEMQAEAWVILEKCLMKFKLKNNYCFYFYFNKSLGRNFYRMFDKEVRKKEKYEKYETEKIKTSQTCKTDNLDFPIEMIIESIDLSENEEKILRSKLVREKKSDFLDKNKNLSSGKYYTALKNIKEKINKLKDDGEL